MGRPDANPTSSQFGNQINQPQPQEYHFQTVTQSPETIDDEPPPFEAINEESQEDNYENETSRTKENSKINQQSSQSRQKSQPAPPANTSHHQTQPSRATAFPPQSSQAHNTQAVQQNHQKRSPISDNSAQTNPQAFPPSESEAQAFPPSQDHEPQAFPPPQDEPQAFPPPQGEPQAFPPPQDETQAFPPPQGQAQAFHPPQQASFQHPDVVHFPPAFFQQATGVQAMPAPTFLPNPPQSNPQVIINNTWKTGLFECMNDPGNALITVCFPCVTFGQIAEIVDSGQTSCGTSGLLYGAIACCIAMPCLMSCTYRTKLRNRFGLPESPAPDCITHCFCECCALCQEYRELRLRGIDPSIGWQGNVMKAQNMVQIASMTPPVKQTMMG